MVCSRFWRCQAKPRLLKFTFKCMTAALVITLCLQIISLRFFLFVYEWVLNSSKKSLLNFQQEIVTNLVKYSPP
jgi:hypothetical protein